MALAREQTFAGTTIEDIAVRLGVSKAAVYYHFRAKEQLLADLVGPLLDALEELVEGGSQPESPLPDPRTVLREYLDVLVEHRDVVPLVVQDVSVINHPVLAGRPDELDRRLRALLASALDGPAAEARATAALAALRRPVLVLPVGDVRRFRRSLLAAAAGALGLPRGRGRKTEPAAVMAFEHDPGEDRRWTSEVTVTFPPSPGSVGPARRFARTVLSGWSLAEDVVDNGALVMSEMAAYALAAGDPDRDLEARIARSDGCIRIEVQSEDAPAVGEFSPPESGVRPGSVPLVDLLATAWGIERRRGEYARVWAELPILAATGL
ncbi:MAG: TetR/AcrR family transcriptional regulator; helix-turn-helix transcriptional regulator [Actinobacteria bacterium]|nr:TetR/AcrR family transcriptional regulator; helix-turn-helix transcriptional regulator [Actinomycetota bacterium]